MVDLRIVIGVVVGVVAIKYLPLLFTVPGAIAAVYIYVFTIRFREDMEKRPYLKKTYGLVARHSARLAKNIAVGGKLSRAAEEDDTKAKAIAHQTTPSANSRP